MLSLVPPRSFVLSNVICEISSLLTHAQEVTSFYFKALCDFQALFPLLQNVRKVMSQISDMSTRVPLASDGIVACCVSSILLCLKQVVETTISIGESCLSVITPTWQCNEHIYDCIRSAYVQTALAVTSANFRHMYSSLPTSSTFTDRELYIIIALFWENMLGYRPEAPASEVLSLLLVWLDAKDFYDKNDVGAKTSKTKENFLADITTVAISGNITSNDLFCYAHIFNYFLYQKLHTAVGDTSLEDCLFALAKEARMAFMDDIFPGILPLKNMTEQTYINPAHRTLKYDTFWLQFDQTANARPRPPALIDLPRSEFVKDIARFGDANVLLNEDFISIPSYHLLEERLKVKARPAENSHDAALEKTYTDKAVRLQEVYANVTSKLSDHETGNIAAYQDFYLTNLTIIRQLSFCYMPSGLRGDQFSSYVSMLPAPLLDLGIVSVPHLAEYVFYSTQKQPLTESLIGLPADFEHHVCGVRVFTDLQRPQLSDGGAGQGDAIEHLFDSLNEIRVQRSKDLAIDLSSEDFSRTDVIPQYSGKDYELSQTVLRTISGTPILLQRYIERECRRALTSVKALPSKIAMVRICEGIKTSLNSILDDCVSNIMKYNPKYKMSCYTDIVLELFNAIEVAGYETFSKVKISTEMEVEDLQSYVFMAFPKLITLYINTAIICGSEFDKDLTRLTKCILPFGGLSCRLAMAYLNKLNSKCISIDQYLTVGIVGAINSMREIVAAKAGYSSGALEWALAFRGLLMKQNAITSADLILPSIATGHEGRLNYHASKFKDDILATCIKGKNRDKYYNPDAPDLHAHKRNQEQEYMRMRRSKDLYHELGYMPMRTFTLPLVKATSFLGATIGANLSLIVGILRKLPITLAKTLSICRLYAQTILDIPRVLSTAMACAEVLHIRAHNNTPASLMGAFPLTETFVNKARELLKQKAMFSNVYSVSDSQSPRFRIVVSGTAGSGVTSLVKILTLSPMLQYATPLSAAAGESILFMESHMVSEDSNAKDQPWYLCEEQRARRVITNEISTKDTLSIGSWLSCDSAQEKSSKSQNDESLMSKDELEDSLAKNTTDATILQLLREIKGISLASSALDLFNSGLDDELKVAMDSGKNIREYTENGTAIVTYNHIAINNNSLFVMIPPQSVSYAKNAGLEPSSAFGNIMDLFGTEATDFRPRGLIDYDSESDYIFHNRYIESDSASTHSDKRSIELSARFDQAVTSLADTLHSGVIEELEQSSHLLTREAILARKSQEKTVQTLKKKLPLIDFKLIKHVSTLEPIMHTIDLLPLYSGVKLDILDIPMTHILPDLTMQLGDEHAVGTQEQDDLPTIERNLNDLTAKYTTMQRELLTAVQEIHAMFAAVQPGAVPRPGQLLLAPDILAAQREAAIGLVNPQRRQVQIPTLETLLTIVADQHMRASQQFITENAVVDRFVAALKVQYDKLSLEQPPQAQHVVEYNRQLQLLESRKAVVIGIKTTVESLGKELTILQKIKALSPGVVAMEADICALKQKMLAVKECRPSSWKAGFERVDEAQLKRVSDLLGGAELFVYVYDCTSSIHQFGINLQKAYAASFPSNEQMNRLNHRYTDSSTIPDKIILDSPIYKKLIAIKGKTPGLIVCSKCDVLTTNGSTKSLFFGMRLAELLNWPHFFASSRTGAFVNSVLRSAILKNMRLMGRVMDFFGTNISRIYNSALPLPAAETPVIPEFMSLFTIR